MIDTRKNKTLGLCLLMGNLSIYQYPDTQIRASLAPTCWRCASLD